jgi:ABC-type oligopeptide transport system substrate-binding subunit
MNIYKPTRRQFLTTMACAGAYSLFSPMASVVRAQGKQVLKVRNDRDIQILDPATMVGGGEIEVQFAVLPRLVEFDYSQGKVNPMPGVTVERIV